MGAVLSASCCVRADKSARQGGPRPKQAALGPAAQQRKEAHLQIIIELRAPRVDDPFREAPRERLRRAAAGRRAEGQRYLRVVPKRLRGPLSADIEVGVRGDARLLDEGPLDVSRPGGQPPPVRPRRPCGYTDMAAPEVPPSRLCVNNRVRAAAGGGALPEGVSVGCPCGCPGGLGRTRSAVLPEPPLEQHVDERAHDAVEEERRRLPRTEVRHPAAIHFAIFMIFQ